MPNWKPQRKLSNFIKWGYKIDPQDPQQIVPIPELEAMMDQAFKYLTTGQYSLRDVAAWLAAHSKVPISHIALRNHFVKFNRKKWRARAPRPTSAAEEKIKDNRIGAEPTSGNTSGETQETL